MTLKGLNNIIAAHGVAKIKESKIKKVMRQIAGIEFADDINYWILAEELSDMGYQVVFGSDPEGPDTNFGWIYKR